jgi:hypothetical protein
MTAENRPDLRRSKMLIARRNPPKEPYSYSKGHRMGPVVYFPLRGLRLRKVPAMESLLEYWMDP